MTKSFGMCARVLVLLAVSALAASPVWAGPYDQPYGVQWNFIIGNDAADNPATLRMSPDETVWIGTMGTGKTGASSALTWGNPTSLDGGHYASGYGQISPQGRILQGNDLKAVPGNGGHNQGYNPVISFAGNDPKAYISYSANGSLWTDAVPADIVAHATHPKTWTVASQAGGPQYDYDGTPGAAVNAQPWQVTSGISPSEKYTMDFLTAGYGGSAHDAVMGSDGTYYFARGDQLGAGNPLTDADLFTAGDFSGPAGQSYKPAVGKVAITNDGSTVTYNLSGPAHQPSCGGRSFFSDIDLNDTAGKVYAAGYGYTASGGTMDFFDPDGPGPMAPISFNTSTTGDARGFAVVYDSTSWAIQKVVTWESTYGDDYCTDITATPDGGFVLVGQTMGSLGGKTNPAEGTLDGYMEKYNADGSLAWSYQTQTSASDSFGDVTVDADGTIYVSGNRNNGTDTDPILMKFAADGTPVWTSVVDSSGSEDSQRDHGNVGKEKVYLLSQYNPSAGGTPWTNSISYVPQGNNEDLLQKLSPGDFNTDGKTDWADMKLMMDALAGGPLAGDDTYDFDEDGDSDSDDVTFFMAKIFDSDFGDFNWDGIKGDPGDFDLLGGWMPGDQPLAIPAGWRGFSGPNTPDQIDLEEWLYLNEQSGPGDGDDIPEPATMALLGLAACGLGGYVRRRRMA